MTTLTVKTRKKLKIDGRGGGGGAGVEVTICPYNITFNLFLGIGNRAAGFSFRR
jgi:hypothetical protein